MKNVFFALAFMLIGTFAFANNNDCVMKTTNFDVDTIEIMGVCTVTITEYNADGTTNSWTYQFETSTAQDCFNAGRAILAHHMNMQ